MSVNNIRKDNPIRGRLNSWIFNCLDSYMHYKYKKRKGSLLKDLPQSLVEIGPGTGANLKYFKKGTKLTAIEPNEYMHKNLKKSAVKYAVEIEIKRNIAENMDVKSNSVDAVISTLTLCTIVNEAEALKEIKRILRPGGKFFFLEHVGAGKGSVLRGIQKLVFKPWFWLFEGCHTHKEIGQTIRDSGFSKVQMESFNLYTPFIQITAQIAGYALK